MKHLLLSLVRSSIGKKFIMSITGLGAIGFLVVHLGGNLLIFGGREDFNDYAHHLHALRVLPALEIALALLFLVHMVFGIVLAVENWRARPVRYAVKRTAGAATAASSTMIYSGFGIMVFIALHMLTVHSRTAAATPYDKIVSILGNPFGAITYSIGALALGLHLFHGASSTLQSLGLGHSKYDGLVRFVGRAAALAFTAGFVCIPLYVALHRGLG